MIYTGQPTFANLRNLKLGKACSGAKKGHMLVLNMVIPSNYLNKDNLIKCFFYYFLHSSTKIFSPNIQNLSILLFPEDVI